MREHAISSGIGRRQSPIRGLTKSKTPKNAVVAAVWPLGKELYFELSRGPCQPSSTFTEGRARPVAIFTPRAAIPASAQATIIVSPSRTQRLLPRCQAIATMSSPEQHVLRPIAKPADRSHPVLRGAIRMRDDPMPNRVVKMKGGDDRERGEEQEEQPLPERRDSVHRKNAGCVSATAIFQSLSCNLQPAISCSSFAARSFSPRRHLGAAAWSIAMSRVSPRRRAR